MQGATRSLVDELLADVSRERVRAIEAQAIHKL